MRQGSGGPGKRRGLWGDHLASPCRVVPFSAEQAATTDRIAQRYAHAMRGLLLSGDTERSAALRHEIPIAIIDSLLFAEVDGRQYVLTSHL